MDKNPLLKYMMKAKKEDVIHSSGYAMVQNQGIGAASTSSFEQRQKMEGNRTRVKGYRDSAIASGAVNMRPKAATYKPPEPGEGTSRFGVGASGGINASAAGIGGKPALGSRPMPPRNSGISR